MSNFMPGPPRVRPSSVSTATTLLYAIGGLYIVQMIIAATYLSRVIDVADTIVPPNIDPDTFRQTLKVTTIASLDNLQTGVSTAESPA